MLQEKHMNVYIYAHRDYNCLKCINNLLNNPLNFYDKYIYADGRIGSESIEQNGPQKYRHVEHINNIKEFENTNKITQLPEDQDVQKIHLRNP